MPRGIRVLLIIRVQICILYCVLRVYRIYYKPSGHSTEICQYTVRLYYSSQLHFSGLRSVFISNSQGPSGNYTLQIYFYACVRLTERTFYRKTITDF